MTAHARQLDAGTGSHAEAAPVGGPLLTTFGKWLVALMALGGVMMLYRFVAGLGATTGLSDAYPWGIWIAFDVVTGTGLATGGYALAILVYVLNKGEYHPLVRGAVLTSALGYTMAAIAIVIDIGRYWNLWKVPALWGSWNLNSPLLEVALCVMAYLVILYLELAPAAFEKWKADPSGGALARISRAAHPGLSRALPWIIALGIVLPTMHQSSLGAVFLLATVKSHKLWHTPLLPLLFLVSCIAMGYAAVIFESTIATRVFGRKSEGPMLARVSRVVVGVTIGYLVLRWADLVLRGRLGLAFQPTSYAAFFWLEMALFVVPIVMLWPAARRANAGVRLAAAILLALAGTLYRFDTYIVGFMPGPGWHYFPAVPELLVTFGIIALEVFLYVFAVKRFPILGGAPAAKG